jgi:cation:H+ antiporter
MEFNSLSSILLIVIFLIATIAIWVTGIKLTKAIDAITSHFGLGEAFGGMVFLAIITNLPEIAITTVAAAHRDYDIDISMINDNDEKGNTLGKWVLTAKLTTLSSLSVL